MAIEGIVVSTIMMSLLISFLKLNNHFDQYEKKSIQNFQKKWMKLEERYGKAN